MPRGDRSPHPYRPVHRGTHGYKGVATDAQADPERVYPPRAAVVPADAVTPLTAGGQPLQVGVYPPSGSFTAGAIDVYALTAEPA